jgi:hypothetical protein
MCSEMVIDRSSTEPLLSCILATKAMTAHTTVITSPRLLTRSTSMTVILNTAISVVGIELEHTSGIGSFVCIYG